MNKIQERPIEEIHPNNIEEIIKGSLSDLEKQNPKAYAILIHLTKNGFFKKHQTKSNLEKLARQLIETIN